MRQGDFEDRARFLLSDGAEELEALLARELYVHASGGVRREVVAWEEEDDDVREVWLGGKGEGELCAFGVDRCWWWEGSAAGEDDREHDGCFLNL